MLRIILVRHGETVWNKEGRYQGHQDVALSPEGLKQAQQVAKRLAHEPVVAVYTSDLQRAAQTAQIIAQEHGLPFFALTALRELHFGEWEGLRHEEIRARYWEIHEQWFLDPFKVRVPGGESAGELQARAKTVIQEIIKKHQTGAVVIVAHGGTIRSILCEYLNCPFWKIKQDNTAINILEVDQAGVRVKIINDISHLNSDAGSG